MKPNPFNICPTCAHINTCVLTQYKETVWSCSEYDEAVPEINNKINSSPGFPLAVS